MASFDLSMHTCGDTAAEFRFYDTFCVVSFLNSPPREGTSAVNLFGPRDRLERLLRKALDDLDRHDEAEHASRMHRETQELLDRAAAEGVAELWQRMKDYAGEATS